MNKSLNAVLLRWAGSRWTWFGLGGLRPEPGQPLPGRLLVIQAVAGLVIGGGALALLAYLLTDSWRPGAFALGGLFGASAGLLRGLMLLWAWNRRAAALATPKPDAALAPPVVAAPASLTAVQRWLVQPLIFLAIVATALLVVGALENLRGAWAIRSFRAEQRALGEPVSLPEVLPSPVPDERNLAMAPLLRPLLDYDTGSPVAPNAYPIRWKDSNALARAQAVKVEHTGSSFRSFASDRGSREASWLEGMPTDLEIWQAYFRSNTNWPQAAQPQSPSRDVLLALSRWDAELAELRQAAATRPEARFPIRYEDGYAALLPHLATVRGYVRLLSVRATAALAEKRGDEAIADVLLALRLSDAIHTEPLLISELVRIAMDGQALQPIWDGCLEHRWTEPQLAALQDGLAARNYRAELLQALRGERVFADVVYEELIRRGAGMVETYGGSEDPGQANGNAMRAFLRFFPRGWIRQNQVVHGRYVQAMIDDIKKDRFVPDRPEHGSRFEQFVDKRSPVLVLVSILAPSLENAIGKTYDAEARKALALVGLGLERHRLATGSYPDNLAALAPRFLSTLPVDPMDGQPLRYARTPSGDYHLYSLGPDRQDNGGSRPAKSKHAADTREPGDLVWR